MKHFLTGVLRYFKRKGSPLEITHRLVHPLHFVQSLASALCPFRCGGSYDIALNEFFHLRNFFLLLFIMLHLNLIFGSFKLNKTGVISRITP
ncbi:hypothetical protein D3C73_884340 [compost metagenome]